MGARGKNNTKWLTNVFPRLSEIRDWCMDGKTNEEMCVLLGISPDSWYTYMKQYNQLNDIVTAGKSVIDNRVENSVLKTALGYILREYSSLIEQYSVEEYFLDFTDSQKLFGDPIQVAHNIKNRIREELGFLVNIGVSSNKLLAKMGSELQKPDRVHTLFLEEVEKKMWSLPVEELFMVGRATAKKLQDRSVRTIGHLANADPDWLKLILKSHGLLVWN